MIGIASPGDEELVRSFGAEHFVARGDDAVVRVRALVPDGVDGLLDAANIGRPIFGAIRDGGGYASVRGYSGETERGIAVHVVRVSEYAENTAALQGLVDLAAAGRADAARRRDLPPEQAAACTRAARRPAACGGQARSSASREPCFSPRQLSRQRTPPQDDRAERSGEGRMPCRVSGMRPPASGALARDPNERLERDARTSRSCGQASPSSACHRTGASAPRLFALASTGVSTDPILARARQFLAALAPEQRETATFAVDDDSWRRWSNIHRFVMRHGLLLENCSDDGTRSRALDRPRRQR